MPKVSDKQHALETLMASTGRQKVQSQQDSARADLQETRTRGGRQLLAKAVKDLTGEIKAWRLRTARKNHRSIISFESLTTIKTVRSSVLALITSRAILDGIAHERGYAGIASEIGRLVDHEVKLATVKREYGPAWRGLKRKALRDSRRTARIMRSRKFMLDLVSTGTLVLPELTRREQQVIGSVMLELFAKSTKLVTFGPGKAQSTPGKRKRKPPTAVIPTPEVMAWLQKAHEHNLSACPVYLPSLDVPEPWTGLRGGGYLTDALVRKPLVATRDSLHMDRLAHAEMPEVYEATNLLQGTAWKVNAQVLSIAREVLDRNLGDRCGLPAMDDLPTPPLPDIDPAEQEYKTAKQARAASFNANRVLQSKRLGVQRILSTGQRFLGEDRFYFPHHLDFRGRIYPTPGFLNPQGADLASGLLCFADKVPVQVGPDGIDWWYVHGANTFGLDKLTLAERQAWGIGEGQEIRSAVRRDPIGTINIWGQADKPFQFLAWCLDNDIDSNVPCLVDGSNNGLQIYSLLLGDEDGARATNCLPCDAPEDMYRNVAEEATRVMREEASHGDVLPRMWLNLLGAGGLPRSATKRSTMTNPYGSTLFACQRYLEEWYDETYGQTHSFGQLRWQAMVYATQKIWDAIGKCVPSAIRGRAWFQEVAEVCNEHGVPIAWTAPTGFPVLQRYPRMLSERLKIRTLVGDQTRIVRANIEDWKAIDTSRQRNAIAPNYIHSLDAAILAESIAGAGRQGIRHFRAVHDGFATHAANLGTLLGCVKAAYVENFSLDLLGRFFQDVQSGLPTSTELPPIPDRGRLDVSLVLKSDYFFS